jgi:hypothetical protein
LKACQNLERYVFLLKPLYDVYLELLQPLLDVIKEQTNVAEEENSELHVLVSKKFKFDIDYKFNLHNFKSLTRVFSQALIINIPLLVTNIGHLQGDHSLFCM